jgi:uncharacterized protein YwgA
MFMKVQLEEKEFGDPGKVMLVLNSAADSDLAIDEDRIDSYIYLLHEDDILKFAYPFRFDPLPYSSMLHEDLYNLSQIHFVGHGSSIFITDQGKGWIKERLLDPHNRKKIFSDIERHLKEYVSYSSSQLFDSVYARATEAVV